MKIINAVLLTVGLLTPVLVEAQEGFMLGMKGMPQNTWLLNQDDSDAGTFAYISTWGSAFGLAFQYNFGPAAGIGIDLLYSTQGQKSEAKTPGGTSLGEFQTKLTYLKIPVMFAFSSNAEANMQFYGTVGPQFSLIQDASFIDVDSGEETNELFIGVDDMGNAQTVPATDGFTSPDISVVLALGAQFGLTNALILKTGLRLEYGLTDAEDEKYKADDRAKTVNALGALEVGIFYRIGAKAIAE
jgi:opacity protein-like surface antigen